MDDNGAEPSGGFTLWARLSRGTSSAFAEVAARHRVAVLPGALLSHRGAADCFVRITYARPPELFDEGIRRLTAAWKAYRCPASARSDDLVLVVWSDTAAARRGRTVAGIDCGATSVLERPGKARLSRDGYLMARQIYVPGFTRAGAATGVPAILLTAVNAGLATGAREAAARAAALAALAGVQAAYWMVVHPVSRVWAAASA